MIAEVAQAHDGSLGTAHAFIDAVAGTGAVIALLSGAARRTIEDLIPTITKVETATEEKFQQHFVEAMAIPHATAEYPKLSQVLALPERRFANAAAAGGESTGRRRRRRTPVAD